MPRYGWKVFPALIVGTIATSGCAVKPAWRYYDECLASTSTFREMVDCGKQRRMANCQQLRNCSPEGDAILAYADSLVISIERREITESEARRRWIEFKSTQQNARDQIRAINNSGGPSTCVATGNVVNCY